MTGEAVGSLLSGRPYNQTGVRYKTLMQVGRSLTKVPNDFVVHKEIEKLLMSRRKILETGEGVTMAFAESLAFGCLMARFQPNFGQATASSSALLDVQMQSHPSVHIRLSGQDCIRGTFNQRHAAIICQNTNRQYWQLNHLDVPEQASISVCNSTLSEGKSCDHNISTFSTIVTDHSSIDISHATIPFCYNSNNNNL